MAQIVVQPPGEAPAGAPQVDLPVMPAPPQAGEPLVIEVPPRPPAPPIPPPESAVPETVVEARPAEPERPRLSERLQLFRDLPTPPPEPPLEWQGDHPLVPTGPNADSAAILRHMADQVRALADEQQERVEAPRSNDHIMAIMEMIRRDAMRRGASEEEAQALAEEWRSRVQRFSPARAVANAVIGAANNLASLGADVASAVLGRSEPLQAPQMPQVPGAGTAENIVSKIGEALVTFALGRGAGLGNLASGALADAAFDPREGGLVSLLRDLGIGQETLAALDSRVAQDATTWDRLRGRLMQVGEGMMVAAAVAGLVPMLARALGGQRQAAPAAAAPGMEQAQPSGLASPAVLRSADEAPAAQPVSQPAEAGAAPPGWGETGPTSEQPPLRFVRSQRVLETQEPVLDFTPGEWTTPPSSVEDAMERARRFLMAPRYSMELDGGRPFTHTAGGYTVFSDRDWHTVGRVVYLSPSEGDPNEIIPKLKAILLNGNYAVGVMHHFNAEEAFRSGAKYMTETMRYGSAFVGLSYTPGRGSVPLVMHPTYFRRLSSHAPSYATTWDAYPAIKDVRWKDDTPFPWSTPDDVVEPNEGALRNAFEALRLHEAAWGTEAGAAIHASGMPLTWQFGAPSYCYIRQPPAKIPNRSVVLVHNHPNGSVLPSIGDIQSMIADVNEISQWHAIVTQSSYLLMRPSVPAALGVDMGRHALAMAVKAASNMLLDNYLMWGGERLSGTEVWLYGMRKIGALDLRIVSGDGAPVIDLTPKSSEVDALISRIDPQTDLGREWWMKFHASYP